MKLESPPDYLHRFAPDGFNPFGSTVMVTRGALGEVRSKALKEQLTSVPQKAALVVTGKVVSCHLDSASAISLQVATVERASELDGGIR
jgi:hypothetical protein